MVHTQIHEAARQIAGPPHCFQTTTQNREQEKAIPRIKSGGPRNGRASPMPRFGQLPSRQALFEAFDHPEIHLILSDEYWYGNDPPKWKGAITAATAEKWWKRCVMRLGKPQNQLHIHDGGKAHAAISKCQPNARCRSNACHLCTRAFQRWLVSDALKLRRVHSPGYQDRTINYVFPEGQIPGGSLYSANFDLMMRRCVDALYQTNAVLFGVLAFDISWNDDAAKFKLGVYKTPPQEYWQIHIYGFVRTNNYEQIKDALKALSPEDEKIHYPVKSKPLQKTPGSAISYIFKPTAFKRRSFLAVGKTKDSWKTGRDKALSSSDHVEYLQAAHLLGISNRVALLNLHPVKAKSKAGRPGTIALHPVKPRKPTM